MSARPNRIVSAANRSDSTPRKVERVHPGREASAASAEETPTMIIMPSSS